jgi:ketosteroid isomerase-like protein
MKTLNNPAQKLFMQFCEGYKKRDINALLKLFTQDSNMWGTGVDEYRVGLKSIEEQLQRDWRQSDTGEIEVMSFVPTEENASWAAAVCNAHLSLNGKSNVFADLRGTIIVKQEDGIWKISHMHASFPDFRNPAENSFPQM